jgi:glycosyltransferase involved in cell wall biosynthesis
MTDTPRPRRVAIITYFFPPLGGVGVQRVLKWATYLPRFGWQATIITPRDPGYEITDPDLGRDTPTDIEVHRSFILEPTRVLRRLVRLVRQSRAGHPEAASPSEAAPADETPTTATTDRSPVLVLTGWSARTAQHLARWLFFPDEQLSWTPFAIRSLRAAGRAEAIDAVISSSPPITTHIIAGLGRHRRTPWVADFRDPWIDSAFAARLPWLHRLLQRRIERWIIENAAITTFATPSLRAAYAARYPALAERFVTVLNGYDRTDLPSPQPRVDAATFRIVYAGSLYGERELQVFLDGLRVALGRRPELSERLRVEFIGWLSRGNRELAAAASHDVLFRDVLTFTGFRPHDEALRRVAAADAGLLVLMDEPGKHLVLPVKMFDYLGLDRQVLAAVPPGDVDDLLRELGWGIVVRPNPDSIADGLLRVVDSVVDRSIADPAGRYDRLTSTAALASLLTTLDAPDAATSEPRRA